MLIKPIDSQLLSFFAFLVIDAIVLNVFERDEFLDAIGSLVSEDRMVFIIEQLLIFSDDEQFGA